MIKDKLKEAAEEIVEAAIDAATGWAVIKATQMVPELLDFAVQKANELGQNMRNSMKGRKCFQKSYCSGFEVGRQNKFRSIIEAMREIGIDEDTIDKINMPKCVVSFELSSDMMTNKTKKELVRDLYEKGIDVGEKKTEEYLIASMKQEGIRYVKIRKIKKLAGKYLVPKNEIIKSTKKAFE
ncbi:MAG: hypothetical protein IKX68_08190 [Clostridiales bacterium]|nr:hypothetical protein [Clostridiales bacterium]